MKRRIYRTSKIKHKMDVFQIVLYVIVSLYVLSMIFVLGFGLLNSFKAARDYQNNLFGLPRFKLDRNNKQIWGWRLDNYPIAFRMFRAPVMENGNVRDALVMEMFLNSLIYAVGLTVFTMASEIIMAYAIAKYDFKLKKFFYGVAVVVMLIPIIGSLASEVKFADALHLKDSFLGVFIMKCKFTGIYFLVFYAAFKSISWTYAEAAQIDGASHLRVFLEVMLPLVGSTVSAVFVLLFIEYWNDYYVPMIFMPNKPTLSYGLFRIQSSTDQIDLVINGVRQSLTTPRKLAACFMACIPILIVFIIFRDKIMGNVTMGGIKG